MAKEYTFEEQKTQLLPFLHFEIDIWVVDTENNWKSDRYLKIKSEDIDISFFDKKACLIHNHVNCIGKLGKHFAGIIKYDDYTENFEKSFKVLSDKIRNLIENYLKSITF